MESSTSPVLKAKILEEKLDTQHSKKRKVSEKTVVTVKIEEGENKKQKSEGPPSDAWTWRKYGQKPIKGSPYPRGYYRCSTSSKGCSAKKQVERCRTDASLLIITYTCTHNHSSTKQQKEELEQEEAEVGITEGNNNLEKQDDLKEEEEVKEQVSSFDEDGSSDIPSNFHYIHPPLNGSDHQDIITNIDPEDDIQLTENLENVLFDEKNKPLCYPHLMTFTSHNKSEENGLFDELGELPTSSFTSFMWGNFFEDRILIHLP